MPTHRGRRSGLIDQRDRGRKRRRDIHDQVAPIADRDKPGYAEALEEWLPNWAEALTPAAEETGIEALKAFPIKLYLQESASFSMPPGDRLRFLAIYIEEQITGLDGYETWLTSDRLYKEAIRIDPKHGPHHMSRALSALHLAHFCSNHSDSQKLLAIAMESSTIATELEPSSHSFCIAGEVHYEVDAHQSMEFYRQALEIDPTDPWSCLYWAHNLHDLERWTEAAQAYGEVPKNKFTKHAAWRMDLLRQQRAACLLMSGERAEARLEFETILDQYERLPSLAERIGTRYFRQACDVWPEFLPRIKAIEDNWKPSDEADR